MWGESETVWYRVGRKDREQQGAKTKEQRGAQAREQWGAQTGNSREEVERRDRGGKARGHQMGRLNRKCERAAASNAAATPQKTANYLR